MKFKVVPTENFAEMRLNGGYYVDKTKFLEQFLNACPEATLFTRPRRFGKSLFMSMLAEFFDIRKQNDAQNLFEDLYVSANKKLCQEWMHQYPVVSITLKDVDKSTFSEALKRIKRLVSEICEENEDLLNSASLKSEERKELNLLCNKKADTETLGNALFLLTKTMSRHYGKQTILLIDEYDVPVAKSAEKGYYDEMIEFMRDFLSRALKSNPHLKFAILTGALRITKESMFTGLNNLMCFDISSPPYADVFGFTQDEVDKMLADAGCEEKRDIIREWYDGYHFGDRTDMYCPWSITNYLHNLQIRPMEPQAYWTNTSGNELTKGFVDHAPENVQDDMASLLAGKSIAVQVNETLNYNQVYANEDNFWTLLYLTGYLTPSGDEENCVGYCGPAQTLLAIPNREVRKAFDDEIKSWFADILPKKTRQQFFNLFWDADAQGLEKLLTERMLSSASVRDYQYGEHFYHALLLGIFLLGDPVTSNRESGTGFPDLVVVDKRNKRAAVIELKVADTEDGLEKRVQAALRQIATRKYDAPLKADGGYKHIFRWGMAFCRNFCRMAVMRA